MKVRDTSVLSDEGVIEIAQAAIQYTHQKLPLGSVNKEEDMSKPNYYQLLSQLEKVRNSKKDFMYRVLSTLTFFPTDKNPSSDLKLQVKARYYEKYKIGNCKEQVTVALAYLKKQGFDDVSHCIMLGSDHAFLLLNGSIICDPWANKAYHVRDFERQRELAKEFRYARIVYDEMPMVQSYMFGVPYAKKHSGRDQPPAIIRGQFVRAGSESTQIDYSEAVEALQAEQDRIHGPGIKTSSLDDFFVANSREITVESLKNVSMERRCLY